MSDNKDVTNILTEIAKTANQGEFFKRYSDPSSDTNQNLDLFIARIPDSDPRKEVLESYINQMRLFATEVMQYPQKNNILAHAGFISEKAKQYDMAKISNLSYQLYVDLQKDYSKMIQPSKPTPQSVKYQQDMKDDNSRLFQLFPKYPLALANLAKKSYSGSKEYHQARILKEKFVTLVNEGNSVEIVKLNPLKDVYINRNNMQVSIDKVFKEIRALQHLELNPLSEDTAQKYIYQNDKQQLAAIALDAILQRLDKSLPNMIEASKKSKEPFSHQTICAYFTNAMALLENVSDSKQDKYLKSLAPHFNKLYSGIPNAKDVLSKDESNRVYDRIEKAMLPQKPTLRAAELMTPHKIEGVTPISQLRAPPQRSR